MSARCCSPARRCLANLGSAFPLRLVSSHRSSDAWRFRVIPVRISSLPR
jgi:hypothetical protein